MLKLLVFISGIIATGAFSLRLIAYPIPVAYSSQPSATSSPAQVASQKSINKDSSPAAVEGASDELVVSPAIVIDVIRTDLIKVRQGDRVVLVQLIGIGTPEAEQLRNYFVHHEEKTLDTLKTMLTGETVFLVSDKQKDTIEVEPWDRYVFLKDMTFLNTELVKTGLAVYQPDKNETFYKYKRNFEEASQEAKTQQQGIWFTPTETPTPMEEPTSAAIPTKKIILNTVKQQNATTDSPTISTQAPTTLPTNTPKPPTTFTPVPQITFPSLQPTVTILPHSLDPEKLFTLINDHRKSMNLPLLQKHEYLCSIAQIRASQIYDEIFVTKNVHAGFYDMNLPYWITENAAHYPSEEAIFNWWLGSPIHRQAIEGKHMYTCGACYGNSCVQLFTSFIPKL